MNLAGILDERAAEDPEQPAIIDREGVTTFSELLAHSAGVADGLRAAGIAASDRVVILAPMSAALYAGLLGAWRLGATVVAVEAEPGADPLPTPRSALAWARLDRLVPCRIPVDRRHNAKVDYPALRRMLEA